MKVIILAICTLCIFMQAATAKSPEEIFQMVASSIVVVESSDLTGQLNQIGSGVVIALGEVVTNCHVIESSASIKVKQGGVPYAATLKYADRNRDLCQLTVAALKAPPAIIGSNSSIIVGERVVAIGAPQGLELTISEGLVSSLRELRPGLTVIQTSAPISPGSSGGGLFNEEGLLIGITTSFLEGGQNLNFALPAALITELASQSEKTEAEQAKALADITELGESLRATDPQFSSKVQFLEPIITKIIESGTPPSEWRDAIEKEYRALSDSNTFEWANKAISLADSQDWQGLIEHGRKWARSDPDNAAAWFIVGQGYDGLSEKYRHVADYYLRNAMDVSDYRVKEIFLNKHDAEIAKSKSESYKALEAYQKAIQLNPQFAEAWFKIGFAALKTDNQNIAVGAYKVLQSLNTEMAGLLLEAIGIN